MMIYNFDASVLLNSCCQSSNNIMANDQQLALVDEPAWPRQCDWCPNQVVMNCAFTPGCPPVCNVKAQGAWAEGRKTSCIDCTRAWKGEPEWIKQMKYFKDCCCNDCKILFADRLRVLEASAANQRQHHLLHRLLATVS